MFGCAFVHIYRSTGELTVVVKSPETFDILQIKWTFVVGFLLKSS